MDVDVDAIFEGVLLLADVAPVFNIDFGCFLIFSLFFVPFLVFSSKFRYIKIILCLVPHHGLGLYNISLLASRPK